MLAATDPTIPRDPNVYVMQLRATEKLPEESKVMRREPKKKSLWFFQTPRSFGGRIRQAPLL
jgi:hypothetical protein